MLEKIPENMIIDWRSGLLTLDVSKLMNLTDKEFKDWRLNEMDNFLKSHKRFTGNLPSCFECNKLIDEPRKLVRYFGASLQPDCFRKVYALERNNFEENEITYFDRVADLV